MSGLAWHDGLYFINHCICDFTEASFLERLWWGRSLCPRPDATITNWPDQPQVWLHTQTHTHITTDILNTTVSKMTPSLLYIRQFCGQVFRVSSALCLSQSEPEDTERVIEASRKKMVMDVRLENRGENAYGAHLNISYSRNLQFSSLIIKVRCCKGIWGIRMIVLREVELKK